MKHKSAQSSEKSYRNFTALHSSLPYVPLFLEKRWIMDVNNPDFHIDQFFFTLARGDDDVGT